MASRNFFPLKLTPLALAALAMTVTAPVRADTDIDELRRELAEQKLLIEKLMAAQEAQKAQQEKEIQTGGPNRGTGLQAAVPAGPSIPPLTIYGVADVNMSSADSGYGSKTNFGSGGYTASRLGIKGEKAVADGIRVVYLMEAGLSLNTGTVGTGTPTLGINNTTPSNGALTSAGTQLFSRQIYAGLTSPEGTITAGRQYAGSYLASVSESSAMGSGLFGSSATLLTLISSMPTRLNNSLVYGKQFRGASDNSDMPITRVLREYEQPVISVDRTDYGLRLTALRQIDEAQTHVRVTNLVFPQAFVIPMSSEMTISQWHVPIDDHSCYWYAIFTSFGAPIDKRLMRQQRLALYELPDYKPKVNKRNNYGFNAQEQRTETYTGMGHDINVHDQWAVESQGAIQDRTREHLGTTDKGIVAYRKLLVEAIERSQSGQNALMMADPAVARALTGPASIDGIAPLQTWSQYWVDADLQRRRQSEWASVRLAQD